MFAGWDSYYVMIGAAAGALIGMLFVVVTLTAGLEPERMMRGADVYMTPTLFNFGAVLAISAVGLIPGLSQAEAALAVLVCALVGAVYSAITSARVMRTRGEDPPHWSDKHYYGFAPTLAYLALATAVVASWTAPKGAAYAIAAVAFALLLIGVRNAWDLATFIAAYHARRR